MPQAEDAPVKPPHPGADWAALAVGDALTVVKLSPDGSEAARYSGTVAAMDIAQSWVVVQAVWTYHRLDVEGLIFAPGDVLLEWFSPSHDFNAFAVHAPGGKLKGWYANVTRAARLDCASSPPTLAWHDLFVDVISLPDGATIVLDEDELAASGLERSQPRLHARILRARDEILDRLDRRIAPFVDAALPGS